MGTILWGEGSKEEEEEEDAKSRFGEREREIKYGYHLLSIAWLEKR